MIAGHNYLDVETRAILDGLPMMSIDREEHESIRRFAREKREAFRAGVIQAPQWVTTFLRDELKDPLLQFRWSFEHGCFVIDRWVESFQCWVLIMYWRDANGQTLNAGPHDMRPAVELLNRNNMQREGYLRRKHDERDQIKKSNEKKGDDMVRQAIDSLSTKQTQEFIDVHRAIHTGEKIVLHGEAEKQMERMYETSKKSPALPVNRSINPGMNPRHYKRRPR